MKISVLCPTFNAGKTLAETLQSVIDQGDENFEIIIADGGSTDETLLIAAQFEPYVTNILTGPDKGQFHAIERAGSVATGDVFYWLNADDIVMPGAFSEARQILSSHEIDYVYSDNFAFNSERRELYVGPTIRGLSRPYHELYYRQLYSETVYMKSFLWPSPYPDNYKLRVYTDYAFFLRALAGAKGKWTAKRLGAFRVVAGQASQLHAERKMAEYSSIRRDYYNLRGWGPAELLLRRALALPGFLVFHIFRPSLERSWRKLFRLLSGDRKRNAQVSAFFDNWLVSGSHYRMSREAGHQQCERELYR
ncbi:glycosyltransferase [Caulobacter sp. X]|uniref:glycosyltransferase n=1 Tax=Caulobacter sp. X TaxID=2048901 RepID=UPI0013747A28|nr:glycosyltransferase [Caulobacter sp. X]